MCGSKVPIPLYLDDRFLILYQYGLGRVFITAVSRVVVHRIVLLIVLVQIYLAFQYPL
jgi:hypothetical protein